MAALVLTGARTLPGMFDRQLRSVGVKRTREPAYGDAAVIRIGDAEMRGAIIAKGYIVIGEAAGLSRVGFDRARLVRAWAIDA